MQADVAPLPCSQEIEKFLKGSYTNSISMLQASLIDEETTSSDSKLMSGADESHGVGHMAWVA